MLENPGNEVDRDQVHGIHQQDPDEDGDRHGRDQRALAVVRILDLLIDERNQHFDQGLHLARNAGSRPAGEPGHAKEGEQTEEAGDNQGVQVKTLQKP
jgi:hypothetical protein